MNLRELIRSELRRIVEDSKTGVMSGTQEKEFNSGLRTIHKKFADSYRTINTKTPASTINYGGCGAFAQLLYYNIKKYLGITPEIIFITDGPVHKNIDINQYRNWHEFNDDVDHICVHIVLKLGKYYVDSSGIHAWGWFEKIYRSYNPVELHNMSISTLVSWVRDASSWNSTFHRYNIGDINEDMVEVLKKVATLKKNDNIS